MLRQKNGGKGKKPNFKPYKHFRSTPDARRRKRLEATGIKEGKDRRRAEYQAQQQ